MIKYVITIIPLFFLFAINVPKLVLKTLRKHKDNFTGVEIIRKENCMSEMLDL